MKALVAIKRVLDYNVRARVKSDGSGVDLTNAKMSMNPFDEIAVEALVRLKEKGQVSEIIAVSIGNQSVQETIRQSMAMGVDRGIHVATDLDCESLIVAKALKQIIVAEAPELIMLGKQAIDDDCHQVGQMLAALLNYPQATCAFSIDALDSSEIQVTREIDGGLETLKLTLPAIVTTDLRLNKPRYPTLPNIMKAKSKPLSVTTLEELGVSFKKHLETLQIIEPPKRQAGIKLDSVAALLDKIKGIL